jgi:predicted nucleic acid-binding protein
MKRVVLDTNVIVSAMLVPAGTQALICYSRSAAT